jgi:Fe-S cluster assembly iron-binding protein IscA
MADDDWRIRIEVEEEEHASGLLERLTGDLDQEARELASKLESHRLAVSRDGDTVFEDKGIRLLVDRPSLPYVKGSVIDFVDGLQGAGFKVDNPNVIAACGCGSSFRVAEEEEVSAV